MIYRREIDGLRALAVLPVILFHAGFALFSGGFVGVDVFFVISGYLITSIIIAEHAEGTFSLAGFYERRARRILPALFLVTALCIPVAWFVLLPGDLQKFSGSVAAVAVFSSNILFWKESGYFEGTAELKPLLHTWSLAVEEQYYLVFPLFLLAAWKFSARAAVPLVVCAACVSFLLAQWALVYVPTASFFLLPTRGWELLIGALTAFYLSAKPDTGTVSRGIREAGSLAGLAMIAVAILTFDKSTPFPGVHALLPTLGTALVILLADANTLTGRLLQQRVLVGIGLISYSAYLWHQPLLAFARHIRLDDPGTGLLLFLCALSLALAWLTWKYVETPFRDRNRIGRRHIAVFAAVGAGLFVVLGLAGRLDNGHESRFPAYISAIEKARTDSNPGRGRCNSGSGRFIEPQDSCTLGSADNRIGVLLGDSHADTLAYEVGRALAGKGIGLRQMTHDGCPPVAGLYRRDFRRCGEYNQTVHAYITNTPELEWVVLVARWMLYLEQERFDNGEGGHEGGQVAYADLLVDGSPFVSADEATRQRNVASRYVDSVKELLQAGKNVVLVYPIPEAGWNVPTRLGKLFLRQGFVRDEDASTAYAAFLARNARVHAVLDSIGEHPNLHRVRPESALCNTAATGRCLTHIKGIPLYYDDDHLSNAGVRLLVPAITGTMP